MADIHPNDVDHDEIVGDVLIRILSAHVIDDPLLLPKDKKEPGVPFLNVLVEPEEILHICKMAEKSFQQQNALLEIERSYLPIHVVADLHGQIAQVLRIFHTIGSPQKETFLFLGDYVDRGAQGLETMVLLFCFKIRYSCQVFLLRGNHEDVNTTLNYGFYEECLTRFDKTQKGLGEKIWLAFLSAFNWMPFSALIYGKRGKIFCSHGGISPHMVNVKDINQIKRPQAIPPFGLACDLVWSDPVDTSHVVNGWVQSQRGISFNYGPDVLEKFCKTNGIDIVIRGHQLMDSMFRSGYKINPGGRLITIFSAPNYNYCQNNAIVLKINEKLKFQFKMFRIGGGEVHSKRRQSSLFRKKPSQNKSRDRGESKSRKLLKQRVSPTASSSAEADTEVDGSREMVERDRERERYRAARSVSTASSSCTPPSKPTKTSAVRTKQPSKQQETDQQSSYLQTRSLRSEYLQPTVEDKPKEDKICYEMMKEDKTQDEAEKSKKRKKKSTFAKKKT